MASYTTKLRLRKPAGTDRLSRELDVNDQWRKLSKYFGGVGSIWTEYQPIWTCITTKPFIGSGKLKGWQLKLGSLCFVQIQLTAGPDTTFGTGSWRFNVPIPFDGTGTRAPGPGYAHDFSASADYGLIAHQIAGTVTLPEDTIIPYTTGAGGNQAVDATHPFTWGDKDDLVLSLMYKTVPLDFVQARL